VASPSAMPKSRKAGLRTPLGCRLLGGDIKMKTFRPLIIVGRYDRTIRFKVKRGEHGIDGMLWEVNDNIVFRYDFSNAYRIEGTTLILNVEKTYTPIIVNSEHVGIRELNDSVINLKWFEKDVNSNLVIDGWRKYKDVIPFNQITGYFVARDVLLSKVYHFISSFPSWEICLTLPMYMKLTEKIDGFENRLRVATEIGDQIRNSTERLKHHILNGTFTPDLLDDLLVKMHSLADELALAYHIKKSGYDIRFGDKGEADFFIRWQDNEIPCEHKSRFPDISSVINMKLPEKFDYPKALKDIILEVKKTKKALKKSEIFFNNLSRVVSAIKFAYAVEMNRYGPGAEYFNFSDMFANFKIMMLSVILFHEKGKVVVPYIKLVSSDPKIIAPFPVPEKAFDRIVKEKKRDTNDKR